MDRLLRPEKFSTLHSDHNAEKKWKHWKKCFNSFVAHVQVPAGAEAVDKLALLVNYVDPEVDEYITEDASFESAIQTLDSLYLKPVNTILPDMFLHPGNMNRLKVLIVSCKS